MMQHFLNWQAGVSQYIDRKKSPRNTTHCQNIPKTEWDPNIECLCQSNYTTKASNEKAESKLWPKSSNLLPDCENAVVSCYLAVSCYQAVSCHKAFANAYLDIINTSTSTKALQNFEWASVWVAFIKSPKHQSVIESVTRPANDWTSVR